MAKQEQTRVIWSPQPGPQAALVKCPIDEILYGGARGGGKTDGMLGKHAIKAQRYGENCIGVFFRKTRKDLKEAIERSKQIYSPLGATMTGDKEWTFPNKARLKFEYLERDKDAENYQGHNYTDLYFEELTHWADPKPVNKLKATLRSAAGVPCQFHATANPGGPGHLWVKERYIDPAPQGWEILTEEFENPFNGEKQTMNRIFIPSRLTDNPLLLKSNPTYISRLQQSGSKELVKAWLTGDWNVVEGAYFDCWDSSKHEIRPFEIPKDWVRFRSFDWGSAKPFSVGWWAVVNEDTLRPEGLLPRGALVRYREWYGAKSADVGLKMRVEDVAQGIKDREKDDRISYGVADTAIFTEDGGPSQAERMGTKKVYFKPADKRRVPGWDQMRGRLIGDERPMIYTFTTCTDSIRTIPALEHDENKPEDLGTSSEDHAADEWRYACMSRPWTRTLEEAKPQDRWDDAFADDGEDSWKTV